MSAFLRQLDEFDLNEYIRAIRFDQLKVPTAPFQLPVSKTYYGLKEMRAGELDFLKATVLGRSDRPVFMCSDMQMDDMARDEDFKKKYMLGLAMMLKKGLHLNVVHNLDRPFGELMLGLQGWVPLYMTGQSLPLLPEGGTEQRILPLPERLRHGGPVRGVHRRRPRGGATSWPRAARP